MSTSTHYFPVPISLTEAAVKILTTGDADVKVNSNSYGSQVKSLDREI